MLSLLERRTAAWRNLCQRKGKHNERALWRFGEVLKGDEKKRKQWTTESRQGCVWNFYDVRTLGAVMPTV